MGSGIRRLLCLIQAASGLLAFAVLAVAGPVLAPRVSARLDSALASTQSARRMAAMTEELIIREQAVVGSALKTADSISQTMAAMKEPLSQVTENAAYWGERLAPLARAAEAVSGVLSAASEKLPFLVPTGISVETRKMSLGLGSVEVPSGLSVHKTPFFEEEKTAAAEAARDLSDASARMSETSRLLQTGGGGLSRDALASLAAAEESLALARTEMAHLNGSVLPGFLAEARAQKEELAKASSGASWAIGLIWPGLIAALVFSLLWSTNGFLLFFLLRKTETP